MRNSFVFLLWSNSNIVRVHYNFMSDSVRATVAEMTGWCTMKVIDIERAAISHLDVGGPVTAV